MIPVLIIGKSGAGKSASLRTLPQQGTVIVNVLGKPLPFRGTLKTVVLDDYKKICASIRRGAFERCVIDDAGYLITNQFMDRHNLHAEGNAVYKLYNDLADDFWRLVKMIQNASGDQRIYLVMHEDKSESGDVKPRTIGKLLDEKVCLEGLFTICLRAMIVGGRHVFRTQSDGFDVAKSPMDMFPAEEIDNDLGQVDRAICEYYGIGGNQNDQEAQ